MSGDQPIERESALNAADRQLSTSKRNSKQYALIAISACAIITALVAAIVWLPPSTHKDVDELAESAYARELDKWRDVSRHPRYQELLALPYELPPGHKVAFRQPGYGMGEISHLKEMSESLELLDEMKRDPDRKVLMTDSEYPQIFLAYADPKHPVFITSDSILNTYHVAFANSFKSLEEIQADQLPTKLWGIQDRLQTVELEGDPELVDKARRLASIIIGVAAELVAPGQHPSQSSDLRIVVDYEVKIVQEAKGQRLPQWLGEPQAELVAIDYGRFRPQGFYSSGSFQLRRFYQAVQWLQAIPLHSEKQEHLTAAWLLAIAAGEEWDELATRYRTIFGESDQIDLVSLRRIAGDLPHNLESLPELLARMEEFVAKVPTQSHDQIGYEPESAPSVRVLSSVRAIENELFDDLIESPTTDLRTASAGLRVCASLRSSFAQDALSADASAQIKTVLETPHWPTGDSLHVHYLRCLKSLLDEPDAKAPHFMWQSDWHRKSCQTVSASWAQARNVGALGFVADSTYLNGGKLEPWGFVEPDPEFFERFAEHIEATAERLDDGIPNLPLAVARLADAIRFHCTKDTERITENDKTQWYVLYQRFVAFGHTFQSQAGPRPSFENLDEYTACCAAKLHHRLTAQTTLDTDDLAYVEAIGKGSGANWSKMADISRKLALIARTVMEGNELTENDSQFIRDYGNSIAGFFEYNRAAAETPRDDAFRSAVILSDPKGWHLHAAVARPRALYVLYPYQGKEILCRGAVMPYYEFIQRERLSDQSWHRLYDSNRRPAQPKWLAPLSDSTR